MFKTANTEEAMTTNAKNKTLTLLIKIKKTSIILFPFS